MSAQPPKSFRGLRNAYFLAYAFLLLYGLWGPPQLVRDTESLLLRLMYPVFLAPVMWVVLQDHRSGIVIATVSGAWERQRKGMLCVPTLEFKEFRSFADRLCVDFVGAK